MNETTQPQAAPPCNAAWWRAGTIACLLVIVIAVPTGISLFEQFSAQINHLQAKLKDTAQIKFIAVLLDEQQAPALLVTLDPLDHALQIQRLNRVVEGGEDSMQLWALPANGKPRSLGILATGIKTLRLPATEQTLTEVPQLAISVETKGGAEDNIGPRLPYLF